MTRKELLLLVLSMAGDDHLTPVQLQKSLFLIGENCRQVVHGDVYEFEPYNYGPFCRAIYEDMQSSDMLPLVKITRRPGRSWAEYGATAKGLEKARAIDVSEEIRDYVRRVVAWTQRLSFADLVKAIYAKYPDYKKNSVFRG